MCGRFSQSMTREDYLAYLAKDAERDIPYDPEPIGRYNIAPGTKVLLVANATNNYTSMLFIGITRLGGGIYHR